MGGGCLLCPAGDQFGPVGKAYDSISPTAFLNTLNQNNRGIQLNFEMSQSKIHFLYLTIKVVGVV